MRIVSLAEARGKVREVERMLLDGVDPIAAVKAKRTPTPKGETFGECAERYIAAHEAGWRNPKHRAQWRSTLATYVLPRIGETPVTDVSTSEVIQILEPLWRTRSETARRVRGRIEVIIDWATAHGLRDGANPARFRGHLDKLLPRQISGGHHAAMPFEKVPKLVSDLRTRPSVSGSALEVLILTAARTGEVLGARWSEIDVGDRLWTVPPERAKSARPHRVPLSDRAMAILEKIPRSEGYIFTGARAGKPLSQMALLELLRGLREGITVHGFRSSFRDWVAERTNFAGDLAEMALAHVVSDKTEAAYRRGDQLEKRRRLMEAWSSFCTSREEPA
jgi:integrase